MAESFAVYCRLAGANIRAQLQYRVSFVIDLIATFLISFLDFLAVLILFHNVPRLAGWSVHEVAFLYGTSAIAFALAELLVGHSEQLAMRLRTGTFDVLLARPRGTLYQVAASELPLRRLGRAAAGHRRLRLRARGREHRLDARPRRDAVRDGADGDPALRVDVGRGAVPPLLDGRRQRVHERVHLRRGVP